MTPSSFLPGRRESSSLVAGISRGPPGTAAGCASAVQVQIKGTQRDETARHEMLLPTGDVFYGALHPLHRHDMLCI